MPTETLDLTQLDACTRCPRMQRQFRQLRDQYPGYWNRPVPPSGRANARLLIVGLAPGKHGANRTGVPFRGDAAGEMLFRVLAAYDLMSRVRITNAVKCLPPANRPTTAEIDNCRPFLAVELARHATILALGGLAHRAILKALALPQAPHAFQHGAVHRLDGKTLVDSYHCSRYNTQTGRLTEAMFSNVVELAATLAGLH